MYKLNIENTLFVLKYSYYCHIDYKSNIFLIKLKATHHSTNIFFELIQHIDNKQYQTRLSFLILFYK